jgi:uncharacterized protein (DUF427 family)
MFSNSKRIQEGYMGIQLTRRQHLLTMLGGAIYTAPSLQAAPQARELQTNFTNQAVRTELSPKWIRVTFGGEVIADSRRVLMVFEQRRTPVYYFPQQDVRMERMAATKTQTHNDRIGDASYFALKVGSKVAEDAAWHYPQPRATDPSLTTTPDLRGYVAFKWDAMDGWYEEGEEVFVHPRDPYHRIDVLQSSRPVKVVLGGVTVAESQRPVFLFETNFPARYYLPKADVHFELLRPSDTITRCPYKGEARYYSVAIGDKLFKDVIWYYRYPTTEASKIANNLAFYTEQTDATFVDGKELLKPQRPAAAQRG